MEYRQLEFSTSNPPSKEELKTFEEHFNTFLETDRKESEEHQKNAFNDFLKNAFHYRVNTKNNIDSVIYNDDNRVEVIIEFKKPRNKNQFVKNGDLNCKALHQSLLYYLKERKENNNNIKHIILATINELYIIDANEFEIFNKDKEIQKAFKNCDDKKGNDTSTEGFYKSCKKHIKDLDKTLKYYHINLTTNNSAKIYQALEPTFLLKERKQIDSNILNKSFYAELLYILGLKEVSEQGKILIRTSDTPNSLSHALKERYNHLDDEKVMQLLICWNNRILFLRLLESLLISFKHFEKPFLSIENFKDFNALNTLFFEVLAKRENERNLEFENKRSVLEKIPYLNSSLFDKTPLELENYEIKLLNNKPLELHSKSILKKEKDFKDTTALNLLEYLFNFLNAYDFTTTPKDIRDNTKINYDLLINPSVLGLVFEKLNGYKEGSFYTPSLITNFMCKESITPIVLDKFNNKYHLEYKNLSDLKELFIDRNYNETKRQEYLNTLLELKICDPSVGSGHFLVSALNELIKIAFELGLIKSLYRHKLKLINDEIVILVDDKVFFYNKPSDKDDPYHEIQKELFELKKSLIENTLFGVDINPNSCEITKLRLWIELLKYSYYIFENDTNTNTLQTLPNIDINIKCGNSLISRFRFDREITNQNIKHKINEYKKLVNDYKTAHFLNKTKKDLDNEIKEIKNFFKHDLMKSLESYKVFKKVLKEHLKSYGKSIITETNHVAIELEAESLEKSMAKEDLFNSDYVSYPKLDKVDKSVGLEHFNNNVLRVYERLEQEKEQYFNAFEWRFEFSEVLDNLGNFKGFDLIIGNPPYIRQEQIKDLKPLLKTQYEKMEIKKRDKSLDKIKFYNAIADIYTYFFALAFNILKPNGLCSFITSNKYTRAKYGTQLREFLLKTTTMKSYTELNALKVFENAIVDTSIMNFSKLP
ncbi:DUF7149 domain-containing protein, partial [Helicobacter cetorum]|uniref:type IIG restriction enzyme/methyltransferase n=1 Tax=Helicobacter cetorum TaxID=138563 RepID=UPI000CF0553A